MYIYICIHICIYIYVPISKNQLRPLHRQGHWRIIEVFFTSPGWFPHRQDSRPLEDGDFLNIDVTARDHGDNGDNGDNGYRKSWIICEVALF